MSKHGYYHKESPLERFLIKYKVYLYPILFLVSVYPLIVKYKQQHFDLTKYAWLNETGATWSDIYLYWKKEIFLFLSAVMLLACILYTIRHRREKQRFTEGILLLVYAFTVILSSVFSEFQEVVYTGMLDQMEPMWMLLGYMVLLWYIRCFVKSKQDVRLILYAAGIGVLLMSLIGISQAVGHDFLETKLGQLLMTSAEFVKTGGSVYSNTDKVVYLTLLNPNYVGMYAALLIPILWVIFLFAKKWQAKTACVILFGGVVLCLYGARSKAGIIAVAGAVLFSFLFTRRKLLSLWYLMIPLILFTALSFDLVDRYNDRAYSERIRSAFHIEKAKEYALEAIETTDNGVLVHYKGEQLLIQYQTTETQLSFYLTDGADTIYNMKETTTPGRYMVDHELFQDIEIQVFIYKSGYAFSVETGGEKFYFTRVGQEGKYQYINPYSRTDDLISADSAVFTGYETAFTNRGFIWSRTIPLLPKYLVLGAGPDAYGFAFPQQDYLQKNRYLDPALLLTKPHCMYLQIAVQTGMLSLLSLGIFYMMYVIKCFRLYWKNQAPDVYTGIGIAIFAGTVGFMISALSTDASVTIMPLFYALLGLGIALNRILETERMKTTGENK